MKATPASTAKKAAVLFGRHRFFPDVPDSLWNDWRWQFRSRIASAEQLSRYLGLSQNEQTQVSQVATRYPLSVTPYYLSLIDPDDSADPVRRQAVPDIREITVGGGMEDPLAEVRHSHVPGLIHRYPDRAVMVLTDICPVFCRHCGRKREWPYGKWVRTDAEIEGMFDYIRVHSELRDIIISGGDPLVLSVRRLERILAGLRDISHVEIIRIASRVPVVLPMRIDDELCAMLARYGPLFFNTHFNHSREVTPEAAAACDRLLKAGIPVNNQTVLLRGINDSVEQQVALSHALLKIKVRPYYLFHCDEVQGTEHLRTTVEAGIRIIEGMRGHTSGLAVPVYAIDLPGGGGKVSLQPDQVLSMDSEQLLVKSYNGNIYRYRNPKPEEE